MNERILLHFLDIHLIFCCFSFQNEIAVYELIHNFVEVLDKYFSRVVSEMLNLMKHFFSFKTLVEVSFQRINQRRKIFNIFEF